MSDVSWSISKSFPHWSDGPLRETYDYSNIVWWGPAADLKAVNVQVFKQEIKPFTKSFLRTTDAAAISTLPFCNNNNNNNFSFGMMNMMNSHWVKPFLPANTVNSEGRERQKFTKSESSHHYNIWDIHNKLYYAGIPHWTPVWWAGLEWCYLDGTASNLKHFIHTSKKTQSDTTFISF